MSPIGELVAVLNAGPALALQVQIAEARLAALAGEVTALRMFAGSMLHLTGVTRGESLTVAPEHVLQLATSFGMLTPMPAGFQITQFGADVLAETAVLAIAGNA